MSFGDPLLESDKHGVTGVRTPQQKGYDVAWLKSKNDYTWLALAMAGYVAAVMAIAALVQVLGDVCVSRMMLLFVFLVAATLVGIAVRAAMQGSTEPTIAEQLSLGHRFAFYGLCIALAICLFYTTGLSFLICQLLWQIGALPDKDSLAWTVLYPFRAAMGATPAPTNGAQILLLGANVYGDIIPFVFPAVAIEAFMVCRFLPESLRPRDTYTPGDSLLSVVIFVLPLYVRFFMMSDWGQPVYNYIYQNFRLMDTFASDESVVGFWLALIAADFFYYVSHRASHIMSWLWTQHSVHHSCESYNLLNGPREGNLTTHFTPIVLLDVVPLALFFPFEIANPVAQVKLVWNFWFHLVLPPPWPTLELLFITPSLHRLHHAKNDDRLGKNFGAIFSIWDRLLGTYEPEIRNENDTRDGIYYGVIPILKSWDAIWVNIQPWYDIIARQISFNGLLAPLVHWTPPNSKCPKLGSRLNPTEFNSDYPRSRIWLVYVMLEMVAYAVFGMVLMIASYLPNGFLACMGLWSASCFARLLKNDGKTSWFEEVLRQVVLVAGIAVYMSLTEKAEATAWQKYLATYALVHAAAVATLWAELPKASDFMPVETSTASTAQSFVGDALVAQHTA